MPSSNDSSTFPVEIIGFTTPRSARALATDAATTDSTGAVAETTFSGPVAERHVSSLCGQRTVDELCRKHGVPKAYTARPAGDQRACTPPPERTMCVYADALEAGMRVPLHGFFAQVLNHFGLAPSQLVPNAWRILVGFVALCHDAGVPPSLAVFGHFFWLRSKVRGWYYIRRKNAATALFTGLPNFIKGWQDNFFFLTSPAAEPWPCPVRWGEPPSNSFLNDPVLTSQQEQSVAKLRGAYGTPVDLRTYLSKTRIDVAFSSGLAGARELTPPPTSTRTNGHVKDQSAKKVVPSASRTEKLKPEPSPGGDTPALSRNKRKLEEANSKDGPCKSDLSSLLADRSCPPGFDPNPRHSREPETRDVDSTGRDAARKEMEHKLPATKPTDLAPSNYESMLQTVNCVSSYALELQKKLADEAAARSKEAAARAELEKKLVARDAEVIALQAQLKKSKPSFENTEFEAALQQVLDSENQMRRRAEHALERYQRARQGWKSRHAGRKA